MCRRHFRRLKFLKLKMTKNIFEFSKILDLESRVPLTMYVGEILNKQRKSYQPQIFMDSKFHQRLTKHEILDFCTFIQIEKIF